MIYLSKHHNDIALVLIYHFYNDPTSVYNPITQTQDVMMRNHQL
jgi:hypothetical protein